MIGLLRDTIYNIISNMITRENVIFSEDTEQRYFLMNNQYSSMGAEEAP